MTVIKAVNSTCTECGVKYKEGYGITTGFSQARWKFLCKDCYSKITMTKDELKQEADEYADVHAFRIPYDGSNKFYDDVDLKASKEGYLAGAEPREKCIAELKKQLDLKEKALSKAKKETKRIADRVNKDKRRLIRRKAELEQKIEKMKCCGNCNGILDGGRRAEKCHRCMDSKELSEWELADE